MTRTVLVIDDEDNMRWVLERALKRASYEVLTASRGEQGLELFARHGVDLVLLDLKMPRMDGLAVLRELRRRSSDVPILLLTAYATVPTAVEAMQIGASDYLRKPFDLEAVLAKVNAHLAAQADLEAEEPAEHLTDFRRFVGASPCLSRSLAQAAAAAQVDYPVLIQGESGSGRRHLARQIHGNTEDMAGGRLLTADCASLPLALLEQELLAVPSEGSRGGQWQLALGGSLVLANVHALPDSLAVDLVAHFSDYLRNAGRPHGLRLLLTAEQAPGPVWQPILERAITIALPPLRRRREDLPLLLAHFAPGVQWSSQVRSLLSSYEWPGNVAELQRVAQQAAQAAAGETVQPQHVPGHLASTDAGVTGVYGLPPEGIDLEELEQSLIRQALAQAQGNKAQAARLLGLSRATLLYRLEKYGIE